MPLLLLIKLEFLLDFTDYILNLSGIGSVAARVKLVLLVVVGGTQSGDVARGLRLLAALLTGIPTAVLDVITILVVSDVLLISDVVISRLGAPTALALLDKAG